MRLRLITSLGFFVLMSAVLFTPTFADQTSEIVTENADFVLVKTVIPMNISSDNTLPRGTVEGTIENHVDGYPVIIQMYQNDEPVHFAQTDVDSDGSYEYKFRVRSVDGENVTNVFQGEYEVRIFQTMKPTSNFSI